MVKSIHTAPISDIDVIGVSGIPLIHLKVKDDSTMVNASNQPEGVYLIRVAHSPGTVLNQRVSVVH